MTQLELPDDDKDTAIIRYAATPDAGHGGIGWYLWSEDYPDEGSVGAFETKEEAEKFALENDYKLEPIPLAEDEGHDDREPGDQGWVGP